jgi:hypothetical protein
MEIAWPSFELSAGMEMAAAGIDEVCSIKVARRRIGSDRIGTGHFGEAFGRSNGPFERKIRSLLEDDGFILVEKK